MNNKGFTLIEILVVIVIMSIIGVSSSIVFKNVDKETAQTDLVNKYIAIQRAASMYFDFEEGGIEQLTNYEEVRINLSSLSEKNYISTDLTDPVTKSEIPGYYYVKFKLSSAKDEVLTCIINEVNLGGEITEQCISNSEGLPKNCCVK